MEINGLLETHRKTLAIADHGSYHTYLTRRILSLRRKLGLTTAKSAKFVPKPVTKDDVDKDVRYIELLILQSERAWARAMHIKSLRAEGGLTGRDRSEVISKCAKAAKLSSSLADLVQQSNLNKSRTVVESRAYEAMMRGSEVFEKLASGSDRAPAEAWEKSLQYWSTARVLYSTSAEHDNSELSRDLIANIIDPTLRYAAYQAGIPRTVSMQETSRKYFSKMEKLISALQEIDPYALTGRPKAYGEKTTKGEVPQTIVWRGRSANIVDASIGQALAGVYAAEAKLRTFLSENQALQAREQAAAYDEVLIASQDAADATKRAADELEKDKVDESNPRMQNLRVTSLATIYNLISWRVGRNRVLIGDQDGLQLTTQPQKRRGQEQGPVSTGRKLATLKERIVLLDAILQSIESIKDVRGAMRDETFVQELDDKLAYFRALKCVSLSYSHRLCDQQLEALALLTRAKDLLSKVSLADSTADKHGAHTLELSQSTIDNARSTINTLQLQSHARASMRQVEEASAARAAKNAASSEPWINKLEEFPLPGIFVDPHRLVSYPPKLEPVPLKPIFLDIAWNYIDYPGRQAEIVTATNGVSEVKQEEKKRGWFGFGR